MLLFVLWCAPTVAQTADAEKPSGTEKTLGGRSAEEAIRAVEAELAAAQTKLAAGPSGVLMGGMTDGVATKNERDEWSLLLNLRIASLEKHLDALRNLGFEIQSHEEQKARAQAWSGFAQPPPYSIDFIDDLWSNLIARQQDIAAVNIARNLMSTQANVLRGNLDSLQKAARQAAEQAVLSARGATPEQARLNWLSELAGERVLTTLTTLQQYEAMLRFNDESLAILQSKAELLRRQIAAATAVSPLTQSDLDSKLTRIAATRSALEQEMAEAVEREQAVQETVRAARKDLQQRQADAVDGNAADRARVEFAQAVLEARKAQAETAMLRQEALRLLLDAMRGAERIWRARFEVAHAPGVARLREMRALIVEIDGRIELWKQYLSNSMDAAVRSAAAAENQLDLMKGDSPERAIAEAVLGAYQQRKALYERMQTEVNNLQLLLQRWEQEVLAKDDTVSRIERLKDLGGRAVLAANALWNFEVFSVQDTITVEGREVTGSSSITIGKIVTVLLMLTLGLWIASLASARFSLLLRRRFDMNKTAAALLERGLYIVSVIVLILLALDIVNIPLTVFAFLGGALAIGIGFGAQNLINNFISGLILLAERPISLGDLVEVEGVRGRVRNIGARCSRIRRADGIDMLVPNSVFLEKNVTNLTLTDTQLRVTIRIGVAYGSPLREVTRLLEEAVEAHGKVLKDPQPLILFEDFGDNALMFAVDFWVNVTAQTDFRVVASDLRHMIERLFREGGIVIAYPQRDVHLDLTRPLEVVMKPGGVPLEPVPAS
ncbi:MAG TPA: mechanosensitive ion channel domain-containing protein [Gammaproteobacteria bacterium]